MELETIPPTELARYLNQVDLYSLTLTNKRLRASFTPFYDRIRQFSKTRAKILYVTFNMTDTFHVIVEYSMNKVGTKTVVLYNPKSYNYFMDFSIIVDLVKIENLSLQIGDRINFHDEKAGYLTLYVIEKKYIPKFQPILLKELDENTCICNCIGMVPFQNISPYHWNGIMTSHDLLIQPNDILFYKAGAKEVQYIELIFEKFRFRLNCSISPMSPFNSEYVAIHVISRHYITNHQHPIMKQNAVMDIDVCLISGIYPL